MKHPPLYPSFLIAAGIALVFLTVGRAEQATNDIKFSDPATPGTLKVSVARGDIRIRGADIPGVLVKSESKAITPAPRRDGLRVISASSSFNLSEKNNVITLDARSGWTGPSANFDITVPRNTAVIVSNSWGGDVVCSGLKGDIEVKSLNGEIKLDGIASGALVETMNGEISATVLELREGKPLSFTSMNGEIVLRVPADAKANVRLKSQNGSILTDFDEQALVTKVESIALSKRTTRAAVVTKDGKKESDMRGEIHAAVHEAVKAGVEAAREAAAAMREAAETAKEAAREASDYSDAPRSPMPPRPPVPPMTGGKLVTGTLNGGGSDIQVATMNGDVTLRKLEPKK